MSDARRLQVYEHDQIRVTYDPNICRHSGVCIRTLPAVFDVRRHRWIAPEAATAAEVMAAVAKCPSGALRSQLITGVIRAPGREPSE